MSNEIELEPLRGLLRHLGNVESDLISRRAGLLYHYTDLNALTSIIEHHDLWLSHARYSNDVEEMNHGFTVAQEVISEMRKGSTSSPSQRDYLRLVKYALRERTFDDVYISCFCEEENRLSQWRGYGGNGTGVELQFSAQDFSAISGPDCPIGLMRFWKVYYEPEKQRERVREILEHWWREATSVEQKIQHACDAIRFFVPTFKNRDFREESEWRLIFTPGTNCVVQPRFRVSRGMLMPYFSLRDIITVAGSNMPQLPIHRVCIGPSGARDLNVASTRMLLDNYGYTNVEVIASPTPFRP